jgi:hypothetical protein
MRFVAGLAGKTAGMRVGVHLREALGFGCADRMTANTEHRGVELGRHDRGVVGMLCQRAMTGFAIYVHVLAVLLHCQNVCVTGLAGIVAGEVDRAGGDLSDGGSAVVAVLTEALWDNKVPDHEENEEGEYEQKSEPEKMSCIFEKLHGAKFPSSNDRDPNEVFEKNLTHLLIWPGQLRCM